MAVESPEESTALSGGSDIPPSETNELECEKKENGSTEPETEQQAVSIVEPKMEDGDVEADEEKPAAIDAAEAGKEDSATTREAVTVPEEPEERPPSLPSLGGNNGEDGRITMKEELDDDSRSSGISCDKSTSASEDGEKSSSGGELGDKRRSSMEVSSSDGEPSSEDSVCSTATEMESIGSSGRSTPALLNGQSSARSSATKTMSYNCCWDRCPQCFNSSPDLAEHIRGIHVDGQRGGVGLLTWFSLGFIVQNTEQNNAEDL